MELAEAFGAMPTDEMAEIAVQQDPTVRKVVTQEVCRLVREQKTAVPRETRAAREQMGRVWAQVLAEHLERQRKAAERTRARLQEGERVTAKEIRAMRKIVMDQDDPTTMVVLPAAQEMKSLFVEKAQELGLDGRAAVRFSKLSAQNASAFLKNFSYAGAQTADKQTVNKMAMGFMDDLRGGHHGGRNDGPMWWQDPECEVDHGATRLGARKRQASRGPAGEKGAKGGSSSSQFELISEEQYYEGVGELYDDLLAEAGAKGEPLLTDFYHTAIRMHKRAQERDEVWEGDGAEFHTRGGGITFERYMRGASHINVILMARLLVREESLWEAWQYGMHTASRGGVHQTVRKELERLLRLGAKWHLSAEELRRRKEMVDEGEEDGVFWDICYDHCERNGCALYKCKYMHATRKP